MNGNESAESPLLIGREELGARAQGSQIANGRKERSDKGKPREKSIASKLSLMYEFDLENGADHQMLIETARFWIEREYAPPVLGLIARLLKEIERLRK
jgi:hypothetical protein